MLVGAVCLGLVVRSVAEGPRLADGEVPSLELAERGVRLRRDEAAATGGGRPGGADRYGPGDRQRQATEQGRDDAGRPARPGGLEGLADDQKDFTKLRALGTAVEQAYAEREKELTEAGLVLATGRRLGVWFLMVLPLLVVALGFGVPRLVMGLEGEKPSGYLFVTLFAAVIAFIVLSALTPRRTRRADAALARLKDEHGR